MIDQDTDEIKPESQTTQEMIAINGFPCRDCNVAIHAHEALACVALGLKNSPRCFSCLAQGLKRTKSDLLDSLLGFQKRLDCYRAAWQEANRIEKIPENQLPVYLEPEFEEKAERAELQVVNANNPPARFQWDAGDLGCGELVLALRTKVREMNSGEVLHLVARDPAAPEDIPAWCRLTGHRLQSGVHPDYFIQRKEG